MVRAIIKMFSVVLVFTISKNEAYENEYGPEYGEDWMFYVADNGSSYVLNFSMLPNEKRDVFLGDAYFYLYTRNNIHDPESLEIPEDGYSLKSVYFNKSNNIKALTHGWLSGEDTQWLQDIKETFLKEYNLNIITIDWSELSKNPIYPWSAFSTRYVGKRLAKLLNAIMETYDLKGANMHLIGHSLGAQVMGYAGLFSKDEVQRITGLDPARPLFEIPYMEADYRLEKSDAKFVDIIHTCAGIYGYKRSHGHADFYPNNGKPPQPGCKGVQQAIEGCSHGRSVLYFRESIEYQKGIGFVAYPCESWKKFENRECTHTTSDMANPAHPERHGDFFLHTRSESKYAVGNEFNDCES